MDPRASCLTISRFSGGALFVFLLVLAGCSNLIIGNDGEDTVLASDASGQMNRAITAKIMQCRQEQNDTSYPAGGPCVGALVGDRLLRKGDVDACIATLLSWQCPANPGSTGIWLLSQTMNQYAINCPAKSVPFLFNDVGPPWQGNILSLTGDEPTFYYACF